MTTLARLAWFIAVGCTAAAVHFGVVVLLVEFTGLAPLLANVAGWLVAFIVSFCGQWRLTFRGSGAPWRQALRRFFLISLGGFSANEATYAVLLHFSALPYDLLLALVLVAVAVMTYLLSSRWAFRGSPRA
jgi:putative flippase GtrA